MNDFEYIYQQVKKAHYSKWNDEELRKCVDMLIGLTHEQLFSLYTSKWLKGDKVMRERGVQMYVYGQTREKGRTYKKHVN